MGRSRNNRRPQRKQGREGATSDRWDASTKPEILHYLVEYRTGCAMYYHTRYAELLNRHVLSNEDSEAKPVSAQRVTDVVETQGLRIVGGIPFPTLCDEVFRQPYVLLPNQLSSRQRRFMHHCCIEADLFHDSIEDQPDSRQMVISYFADGFNFLPTAQPTEDCRVSALYRYKPWYCRTLIDQKEESRAMKDTIWKYIDQPGLCMRDHRDRLEYLPAVHLSTNLFENDTQPSLTECMRVETAAQMKQCIHELSLPSVHEIGFDLESYQDSASMNITCLLQISSNIGKDYIIDVLADGVWDEVHGLKPLFSNPDIVKIGHAIGGLDVQSLHRDFGIFVVNAFDTYEAAKLLPIQQHGLAALLQYYGIDSTAMHQRFKDLYQNCDWRTRPMTTEMFQYARADVHYLVRLRQLLLRDLVLVNNPYIWDDPSSEVRGNLIQPTTTVTSCPDALDFIAHIANMEDDQTTTSFTTAVQSVHAASTTSEKQYNFISSSNSSIVDAMDDDDDGVGSNIQLDSRAISATELRYQPLLMTCISLSQERCLKLYSKDPKEELFWTHDLFVSLSREFGNGGTSVVAPSSEFMQELADWRNGWATELECFPSFLVPMDFLIYVAWKLPLTDAGLRLISQELPPWLKDSTEGRQSLLNIVLRYRLKTDPISISTATIYYYAHTKDEHALRCTDESPRKWSRDEQVITAIVVGSLTVGLFMAVFDALHSLHRRR